jgi:hypothetical protein
MGARILQPAPDYLRLLDRAAEALRMAEEDPKYPIPRSIKKREAKAMEKKRL